MNNRENFVYRIMQLQKQNNLNDHELSRLLGYKANNMNKIINFVSLPRMETLISQYAVPRVRRLEELDFCEFDYSKISQTLNRDRNEGRKILQSWFS